MAVGPTGLQVTERVVGSTAPVWLITARTAHRPYPHKTTARVAFDAAAAEAMEAKVGDALLLTAQGEVAECTIWSLLWWEGDQLAGPPPSLGVLRSVSRMRLEELTGPLLQRTVPRASLAGRSLLVANAVRGVLPVARLDGAEVPPDARTEALAARFWP
jgi:branched-subunit amino acid aminotransferase/4-amino-4-deoxychorismate lyase